MLQNYFKIAWRNLSKNKVFSLINILGLTIGITCCMMIYVFIMNEFSTDSFHAGREQIYRVMRKLEMNGNELSVPYVSGPYAKALVNEYPEAIQKAVRVMPTRGLVTIGSTSFAERSLYVVDPEFFELFSFPLVYGNAKDVLKEPGSVVLTEKTAKRYFGDADPVGKIIEVDKSLKLKVTGIAKNVPSNSHLDFDLIMPIANYAHEAWIREWNNNNNFTYLQLNTASRKQALEKQFPAFMNKYLGEVMAQFGTKVGLSLTPLTDIYFEPHSAFDNVRHGDKKVVYIFLSVAGLILLIACINFINLSTIRALERAREVGMRKSMGAVRQHLVFQFMGESIMLTLIACSLAVLLAQFLMPLYDKLLGYSISISWQRGEIYLFLAVIVLVVGILAGSYPALFLSGFSPVAALKGKLRIGKGGVVFREALVVVQFSISVFLILGTIVIMRQMDFVRSMDLGYDQEHTVVISLNNDSYSRKEAFKKRLQLSTAIKSVSMMSGEPGGFFDMHTLKVEGQNDQVWKTRVAFGDFDYLKTLGLKLIAGRDFSPSFTTDSTDAAIINRTAAKSLGFTPEQAIGKWVQNTVRDSGHRRIIGVVEDFSFLSAKEKMDALVITPGDDNRVAVIRLNPGDVRPALAYIKSIYAEIAPQYPFEYTFLDQKFEQLYQADLRQQTMLSIFAGLAIFIACLGLFGLASYTAARRTKEIGVRKVLGSSVQGIVVLLSKELLKPVLLATLIAAPLGYYVMDKWLNNFSYRTNISWWFIPAAAAITVIIALVTIGSKAIKSALMNPVKSLKSD